MFVGLTEQPDDDPLKVMVWSDESGVAFQDFLLSLAEADRRIAWFLVTYLGFVMRTGTEALILSVSLQTTDDLLRVVYAGPAWMVYFLELNRMCICDQGIHEPLQENIDRSLSRITKHQNAETMYER